MSIGLVSASTLCNSMSLCAFLFCFFFNDTATTEIYTLSLHDALPISQPGSTEDKCQPRQRLVAALGPRLERSEEHTSELQSRQYLVCRLLLEKKKTEKRKSTKTADTKPTPQNTTQTDKTNSHLDVHIH